MFTLMNVLEIGLVIWADIMRVLPLRGAPWDSNRLGSALANLRAGQPRPARPVRPNRGRGNLLAVADRLRTPLRKSSHRNDQSKSNAGQIARIGS
jgi:hypothetical protein